MRIEGPKLTYQEAAEPVAFRDQFKAGSAQCGTMIWEVSDGETGKKAESRIKTADQRACEELPIQAGRNGKL